VVFARDSGGEHLYFSALTLCQADQKRFLYLRGMKKILVAAVSLFLVALLGGSAHAAGSAKTVKGPRGQVLTVSQTLDVVDGTKVTVTGKGYNLKVGIYATYCVIPKKGTRPELCGPFDITGANNQSVWISSNPPLYAALLVKPFGKGGTFKVQIPVNKMIGDQDCTVVKCAILTRADHTMSDYRMADVIVPITLKK
jgi:hypothetical protein